MKGMKTNFGEFLVEKISTANLTQEAFCKKLKIARPYFYDMLKGRPPGYEKQKKMLEGLNITDNSARVKFYDLAAAERKEIPFDVFEYLSEENNLKKIREDIYKKNTKHENKNINKVRTVEKENGR